MDAATLLVLIALSLILLAYVFQPFLTGASDASRRGSQGSLDMFRRRADLLAERNRVYIAIRDLDFDHQTNKVSDEDYAVLRHELVTLGVQVLQQIDMLGNGRESPQDDPIEAALAALGGEGKAQAAPRRTRVQKRKRKGRT
jgi:hypothetical protein